MAIIKSFGTMDSETLAPHKTTVDCKYGVVGYGDGKLIQLNTYGSKEREFPGKLSQTLQLDREQAIKLINILERTFDL